MTEPVNPPVEPVVEPTPPQPEPTPPAPAPPGTPEGFIEKARYDGLVRKTEELTLSNRSLNEQNTLLSSEREQLTGQLAIKDTEKTVAVGEYQKQLETALQTNTEQTSELSTLRAVKAKLDLVKKHNAGNLLPILDKIPYVEDAEAMETIFLDFQKWGEDIAKNREKEILAGYTPPAGPPEPAGGETKPETAEAWKEHIAKQTGEDATKAWDEYWEWGKNQ